MHTTILRTRQSLQALSGEWGRIEPGTPFQSWEFVQTWLGQESRSEPFVVVVRADSGRLLAIAPWCLQRMQGGLRRLTGMGGPDSWQHDPLILEPELRVILAAQLVEGLWRMRRSWDWLSLSLRTEASDPLLQELATKGWLVSERGDREQHHVIEFGESFEAYWAGRSSSHRKKMRALARQLDAVPHRYLQADAASLEPLLESLFAMHEDRWRGLRDWTPYHDQVRAMARRASERGELCLVALEIQGRIAALDLALRSGERGYGLMRVFDPDFAEYAPGSLLGAWMLERLCRMGCRSVDCGPGHYEWKDRYGTGQLRGVRALFTRRASLAGLAAVGWLGLVKPWRTKGVPAAELKARLGDLMGTPRSPAARPLGY